MIFHHGEAEVRVHRRVNICEGRQGHSRSAVVLRPGFGLINETAPNAYSLVFGLHAHLFDVCVSVNVVDEQKSNRAVGVIAGNQTTTSVRISGECFDRPRFVVGDVVRERELLPSATLDLWEPEASGKRARCKPTVTATSFHKTPTSRTELQILR